MRLPLLNNPAFILPHNSVNKKPTLCNNICQTLYRHYTELNVTGLRAMYPLILGFRDLGLAHYDGQIERVGY